MRAEEHQSCPSPAPVLDMEDHLQKEVSHLKTRVEELEKENEELSLRVKGLCDETDRLSREKSSFANQLKLVKEEIETKEDTIKRLESEKARARAALQKKD